MTDSYKTMLKRLIFAFIATTAVFAGRGASYDSDSVTVVRPVTSAFMLEGGSAHRADTYLSPIRYSGWRAAFGYERFQAMRFDPQRWVMALNIDVNIDATQNRARNSTMWGGEIAGCWAMMRRFSLRPDFTVGVGGATTLRVGALYLSRNGNNPVAAAASWTLDASAYATYRFKLGRVPVVAMYRATLPVVGAFFAPEYGQLYYEIYMGDSAGVVSCAHWGSYFALDQRLSIDLRFGSTSLRLGYGFDVRSTKVNDIVTRCVTHTAVVGVAGEWMSLAPSHRIDTETRIISAIY